MGVALRIIDETPGLQRQFVGELRLASERISLRDLMRRRIEAEAAEREAGREAARPLVEPTRIETSLNGPRRARRRVDLGAQAAAAAEAVRQGRIIVIVGDRQVTDLDSDLTIAPGTEVTFLKLVPLVGG